MQKEGELFPEREIVLDEPELHDEQADALRTATDRAERAEAELAKLKNAAGHTPAAKHVAAPAHAPAKSTHAAVESEAADLKASNPSPAHAIPHSPAASSDAALKSPPSPSSREAGNADGAEQAEQISAGADAGEESEGVAHLRNDSMMVHLLDSLDAGKDIGHYGRLTFAMVARHFLPHAEVIDWMTRDRDFSEEQAQLMLKQVEGRDYSPPKRDRILDWQSQQDFPIIQNVDDPDCGNLYRNLKFPDEIYQHIGHYQEQKSESHS